MKDFKDEVNLIPIEENIKELSTEVLLDDLVEVTRLYCSLDMKFKPENSETIEIIKNEILSRIE